MASASKPILILWVAGALIGTAWGMLDNRADAGVRSVGYGPPGPAGQQGVSGKDGSQGPVGPIGLQGVAGQNGKDGAAGQNGAAGPQGIQGPAGPKASTFVCNATITESMLLAISSGIRIVANIACTGVLTTDILEVYPTSPTTFPTGYAVHHALPTAAGKFSAVLSVPALGIGASYTIPVAVYAVNR